MSRTLEDGQSRLRELSRQLPAGTILVTGATGFIGSWLCDHLRSAGLEVRGTTTRAAAAAPSLCYINETDPASLENALRSAAVVLHLGALAHVDDTESEAAEARFRRANVDMTAALLEHAAAAGVSMFVFLSSVKAMEEESDAPLDETVPPRPRDAYGRTKLQAEGLVLEADGRAGMRTAVLRIPLVYGEGMKANMLKLFQLVERGVPLPLGGIRNRRSVIYAGNAAAALVLLGARPAAAGRVYLASDAAALSTPDLIRTIARALGRPARLLPVPPALLHAAARVLGIAARGARGGRMRGGMRRLTGSLYLNTGRISEELGFEPPFSQAEGMDRTARWFIARHRGT
jgi:nucleoside-diphosphate-sugar epimerase